MFTDTKGDQGHTASAGRRRDTLAVCTFTLAAVWFAATSAYAASTFAATKGAPIAEHPDAAPGEVLVKFRPRGAEAAIRNVETLAGIRVKGIQRFDTIGWHLLRVESDRPIREVVMAYRQDPNVLYAEPDYYVHALEDGDCSPNDSRFGELWGMKKIGAPEAWCSATDSDILVAVIDSGVDYTHPDLAQNMWTNPGEVPGNGIDDDANGLVDDVRGWDFIGTNYLYPRQDDDPMDEDGHGTHVAGTIGAIGNNATGVAGACWRVKIMPAKCLDANGDGRTSTVISALEYATKMGVKVTNNSYGGFPGAAQNTAMRQAIEAANQAGALFVAAAGNDVNNNNDIHPVYPASYDNDNVVSVAATNTYDGLAWFSNYGATTVDLGAPGDNILSTVPDASYDTKGGTSMAAPHVTGACALVWAAGGPGMTHMMVKDAVLQGVDTTSSLSGKCVTGGRLNLKKSIDLVEVGRRITVNSPSGGEAFESGSVILIGWSAFGPDWQPGDTVEIDYSDNHGATWRPVAGAEAVDHSACSFAWNTATESLAPGPQYMVKVTARPDTEVFDTSSSFALTGPLDRFDFAMASPQTSDAPVKGTCTIDAKDASATTITHFAPGHFPVAVSAPDATVTGLSAAGNQLLEEDFVAGNVDLADRGMRVTAPELPATVQLVATSADGRSGQSNAFELAASLPPLEPASPSPADGGTNVPVHTDLSWRACGSSSFRLLGGTGSAGAHPFSLVELRTDPPEEVLIGESRYNPHMDFSPDGVLYAASSELRIVDPTTGSCTTVGTLRTPSGGSVYIHGLAFHPNGTLYGANDALYIIDPDTAIATEIGTVDDIVWGIDFAPDGTMYGAFGRLLILDPSNGNVIDELGWLPCFATDIDFAPDGSIYAIDETSLYRVDPQDASAEHVGDYDSDIWGLASQTLSGAGSVAQVRSAARRPERDHNADTRDEARLRARKRQCAKALRPHAERAAMRTFEPSARPAAAPDVTYDVYFGTDNPPAARIGADLAQPICDPTPGPDAVLEHDTTYYWSVDAKNPSGTTSGPVWSFTTKPPPAPAQPENPSPSDGEMGVSVTTDLVWSMQGEGAFRLLGATGGTGPNPFMIVELQLDPAVEVPVGGTRYTPMLDLSPDGVLYGASSDLWIIDPSDGSATEIGTIRDESGLGVYLCGMAFHPNGTLYGLDDAFYTIDPSTGIATQIGTVDEIVWGIDFAPDGTMYAAFGSLYILDPATGSTISEVGSLPAYVADIDYAPDGFIYAVDETNLYRIDPADASTELVGTYSSNLWGVASVPAAENAVAPAASTTFDVYFGTDDPPTEVIAQGLSEPTCDPTPQGGSLAYSTTYYWRIVAHLPADEVWGPVWSFTTEPPPDLHHFEWEPIGAEQGVGIPFVVDITARNAAGGLVTDFAGSVALSGIVGSLGGEVSIGTGTIEWDMPFYTLFESCRTQVIYLASEIGSAGTIEAISLYVSDPPEIPVHNWTIRMKHTALDAYPASPSWEGTGWTTVYEGDETIASIGWVTFALSAPFEYDGTSNLMVDFSYRNDDYAFGRRKCYATATSETRSIYDFAISGDPLSWSGTSPLPSKAEKILNIKILMTSGTEVSISPGITPPFENARWSGEVTVHEEATQMHLQAKGIYGTTGTSNTFDVLPTRELRVKSTPEEVTITGDKPGTTEYSAMCLDGEVVDLMAPEQIEVDSVPYSFVRWVVDLVDQPNGLRDLSVVMDAPHTVEALYRLTRHMLAVQSEPPGMQIGGDKPGTTNYTATCDHGQSVNLLAPEGAIQGHEIYVFKRWLLDGQPHGESQTQLGVLMNEDHTAEAIFDPRFSGDANGDCRVNVLDLIFVRNRLNQDVGTADNWQADVNTDGKINVLDLIYVRNRLNTKCPE